ncbi:hypothetical protein ASG06_03005 [Rathayibacter sp. Leaf185]|nr:hypothetical protein ASF42_02990 [Rathayibacter sp. Leaf294]KQS14222.1 hypothetical protein ASG06_03005 [Rathayibacter sp. Leaf185]
MQLALALDVGGTKVESALVSSDGALVPGSRHRRPTGRALAPDGFLDAIGACVDLSLAAARRAEVVGIGIGSAGPIDVSEGRVSPKNLPLLHGFPLRDAIEQRSGGLPAVLRLDGTCIALAEQWVGANRAAASSMSLVVSTGVGGGIVLEGRIVSGRSGNAGHIGQIHLRDADAASGSDGTLESIASGPSSVSWARSRGWSGLTGEDLGRSAAGGDATAVAAIRRSASAVGTAIASVATLLDIDAFAVGGGFSGVTDWYLEEVRRAARAGVVFDYSREVGIRPSGLGSEGPLIGAAALVHLPLLLGPARTREPVSVDLL